MALLNDRPRPSCDVKDCDEFAVFHLNWAQMRRSVRQQHLCELHGKEVLQGYDFKSPIGVGESSSLDDARCFDIELVVISEIHDQQVVYLREVGGARYVPILTGIFEATCIDRELLGIQAPRPLTHEAMLASINALGAEVESVLVQDLEKHTYFSQLRIRAKGDLLLVDTRPSDAFNIAIRANAPIFFSDIVLAKLDSQSPNFGI